ncbi:MAG: PocR ligand-binding domain-containing protein [Clostridia bacterium]
MNENVIGLENFIQACDFQKLQDEVAAATKIACITVDYTGKPVTLHSHCSAFCKAVRGNSELKYLCEKCDSRGGLEATRMKKPYMYICHMGIVDFAIPIIYQNLYIGAVMCGQILLSAEEKADVERIISDQSSIFFSPESASLYKDLAVMKKEDIEASIRMINYICNYRLANALASMENKNGISTTPPFKRVNKSASIIQPAVNYIKDNFHHNIKLQMVASLCDISPSYFSKLFKKVTSKNLVNYINEIRVEQGKHLLLTTNKPVGTIAFEVGFEDSGYFIKVFKAETGMTPSTYREVNSI